MVVYLVYSGDARFFAIYTDKQLAELHCDIGGWGYFIVEKEI